MKVGRKRASPYSEGLKMARGMKGMMAAGMGMG